MKKYLFSLLFAFFAVAEALATKSDEQLQKEEDSAGLIGIIISIVIIVVAYMANSGKKDK